MIIDQIFPYRVTSNAFPAHCHVRIVHGRRRHKLLIVSELASNPGMSVTNAFEDLLPQIAYAHGLDPECLTVVEHWGPFSYDDGERREEFSRFEYTYEPDRPCWIVNGRLGSFSSPRWVRASREEVELLAGQPLPAFPFEDLQRA